MCGHWTVHRPHCVVSRTCERSAVRTGPGDVEVPPLSTLLRGSSSEPPILCFRRLAETLAETLAEGPRADDDEPCAEPGALEALVTARLVTAEPGPPEAGPIERALGHG